MPQYPILYHSVNSVLKLARCGVYWLYLNSMNKPALPLAALVSVLFAALLPAQNVKRKVVNQDRPLDALVTGDQLWETTPELLESNFKGSGLQWLSAAKDQARFFGAGLNLWNKEVSVLEAIAEFQNGKLARVNLSLFNRGDSENPLATRAEFEAAVDTLKKTLGAQLGAPPIERGKDSSSAVKAMGWMWLKAPTAYLLEYSYEKEVKSQNKEFRPEFIRLRVAPIPKPQSLLSSGTPAGNQPVSKASLTANITKDPNGDVVIKNVPMVDQGPKGYCAVATAERVLRYYGLDVDQHEMAEVANTASGAGTSPTEMVKALQALTGRLKVHIRVLKDWEYGDFTRMIGDYNRSAKHNKRPEINLAGMHVIDIEEIYGSMDGDSLKQSVAAPGKAAYSRFQRAVTDTVNKGIPVMWGVELGIYKEQDLPQPHGGHMRLIIGYNMQTNEILYSDSWGAAHALKRMPMDNACAMTTGLYYLEPNQ
jgi:hypothetical protein